MTGHFSFFVWTKFGEEKKMMVFTLILFYKSKICRSGIFAFFNFFFNSFIYLFACNIIIWFLCFFLINTYLIYDPSVYSIKCVLLYNIS